MGLYFPQWAKDANSGDMFKLKDGSGNAKLRIKVGPLNGFIKHGFLDVSTERHEGRSKEAYRAGGFHSWDDVEPLTEPQPLKVEDLKVGQEIILHADGAEEPGKITYINLEQSMERIRVTTNKRTAWWTWEDKKKNTNHNGYITLPPAPKPEAVKAVKAPKTAPQAASSGILETLIDELVRDKLAKFEEMFTGDFTKTLKIEDAHGDIKAEIDKPHFQMENLMRHVQAGENVYLYGPSGTSKTTSAQACAKALGLPYEEIALCRQSSETLLFGFMAAGGVYVETGLYRAFKNGGVLCIDEMDNGNANVLSKLNSLLGNGHGSFPCGMIERHPRLVVIGTGNTNGNGPTLEFPDRTAFDPAFKERFIYLDWPLDENQEKLIALSLNPDKGMEWLSTVRAVRKAVVDLNIERVLVTPRATYKGCQMLARGFEIDHILEAVIFKGCGAEATKSIRDKAGLN